jgi:hypothetical protein
MKTKIINGESHNDIIVRGILRLVKEMMELPDSERDSYINSVRLGKWVRTLKDIEEGK